MVRNNMVWNDQTLSKQNPRGKYADEQYTAGEEGEREGASITEIS